MRAVNSHWWAVLSRLGVGPVRVSLWAQRSNAHLAIDGWAPAAPASAAAAAAAPSSSLIDSALTVGNRAAAAAPTPSAAALSAYRAAQAGLRALLPRLLELSGWDLQLALSFARTYGIPRDTPLLLYCQFRVLAPGLAGAGAGAGAGGEDDEEEGGAAASEYQIAVTAAAVGVEDEEALAETLAGVFRALPGAAYERLGYTSSLVAQVSGGAAVCPPPTTPAHSPPVPRPCAAAPV
jgi:hypothetical protein